MVRRHGWQLPAHTLQIVAITVFFLLAVAYYVFLAPFLWFHGLEVAALAVYSPLAISVFFLYIRCSAIDPADRGLSSNQSQSKHDENSAFCEISTAMKPTVPAPLPPALSRHLSVLPANKQYDRKAPYVELGLVGNDTPMCSLLGLCSLCCGWVATGDNCWDDSKLQQTEEDLLICTLCNTEVGIFSKHCQSCDKCVDGFDHHCRWLNNCVGRKNYATFVALLAASLMLLVVEWGVGVAVFARCFVDKRGTEDQIIAKLGNGFSIVPFATVVYVFSVALRLIFGLIAEIVTGIEMHIVYIDVESVVPLLASLPLGELLFFHLILIHKGITTYQYVVSLRGQCEPEGGLAGEGDRSVPSSPRSSSSAGLSRSSSMGFQDHGGWCTPPRIFVEHQDEVDPHLARGRVPSTIDPDAAGGQLQKGKVANVRISAWKLAKLNAEEVAHAAARARKTSSVFRQPHSWELGGVPHRYHCSSSSNSSGRGNLSREYGLMGGRHQRMEEATTSMEFSSYKCGVNIGTGREPDFRFDPLDVRSQSRSSCSSPGVTIPPPKPVVISPHPAKRGYGPSDWQPLVARGDYSAAACNHSHSLGGGCVPSDRYGASSVERGEDVVGPNGSGTGKVIPDQGMNTKSASRNGGGMGSFGGSPRSRSFSMIESGGRGITTSVLSAESRHCTWWEPLTAPTLASDANFFNCDSSAGRSSVSQTLSTSNTSLALPSSHPAGKFQSADTSTFHGGPLLPVGSISRMKRYFVELYPKPPRPPGDSRAVVLKQSSSHCMPPSHVSTAPSQCSILVPRSLHYSAS